MSRQFPVRQLPRTGTGPGSRFAQFRYEPEADRSLLFVVVPTAAEVHAERAIVVGEDHDLFDDGVAGHPRQVAEVQHFVVVDVTLARHRGLAKAADFKLATFEQLNFAEETVATAVATAFPVVNAQSDRRFLLDASSRLGVAIRLSKVRESPGSAGQGQ